MGVIMTFVFHFISICSLFAVINAKYNILFIVVDDLRPALGCYGDKMAYSPNIDSLAKNSLVFKNAYAQQALCAPSRNSFLTSRRPDSLHLYDFYSYWRQFAGNFTTLPQHFKEHGYHTKSIGKVFHPGISSNWSDDEPYSWSATPYHPPTEQFKEARVCPQMDGSFKRAVVCPVQVEFQPGASLPDLQSTQEATDFIETWPDATSESFFLAVGFHKPHLPLKYPSEYLDFHPLESVTIPSGHMWPAGLSPVSWNPWTDLRERDDVAALNISFPFGLMPDAYAKLIIQSYYSAVSYIDDLVGKLLTKLHDKGLSDNTIVTLIGDHGWSMAEHGEWSKYSNFEIAVHVPFILHVPGLTDNRNHPNYFSTTALVELVDIFPTLVELTGVSSVLPFCPRDTKAPELCTEGVSIVPLIHEIYQNFSNIVYFEQNWKSGAFSQYPRPGVYPTMHPNSDKPHLDQIKVMGYSLRTVNFRYTEWAAFDKLKLEPDWNHIIANELYDHKLDPEENINLANRDVMLNIVKILSRQLRAGWRSSLPRMYNSV